MSAHDESIPSSPHPRGAGDAAHDEAFRARLARYADAEAVRHRAPESLRARVRQLLHPSSRDHEPPPGDPPH